MKLVKILIIMSQEDDSWFETVGDIKQLEVSFRNKVEKVRVCGMKEDESFLANLGAVLL